MQEDDMLQRRSFVKGLVAAGVAPLQTTAEPDIPGWQAGDVAHILPTVSHERILLKASFHEPLGGAPVLHVDNRRIIGEQTDTTGAFWQFDAADLSPARAYSLTLTDATDRPLCESWPLAAFPDMEDSRQSRRTVS
jgi:hypothetical protein